MVDRLTDQSKIEYHVYSSMSNQNSVSRLSRPSAAEKRRLALEVLLDGEEARRKTVYERIAVVAGVPYETLAHHGYVLQDLRVAGLVERISRGIYRITPMGTEWIRTGKPLTKASLRHPQ